MAMKAMTRQMTAAKTDKVLTAMKVVKKLVAMKAAKASTPKAMKVVKKFVAMKTAKAAATPKVAAKKPAAKAANPREAMEVATTQGPVDVLVLSMGGDGRWRIDVQGGGYV